MIFLPLFLLGAGLNILLGWHGWPAVLAGNLADPDSYMRLLRIEDGVRAGHLVLRVARDNAGHGTMIEWSRLFDALLWLLAAPLAPFLGWHRALLAAGIASGPLGIGALGVALAWAVEPFAATGFLWAGVVATATLPGILTFAAPGIVHYHIALLALIALTAGWIARAWRGDHGAGFAAGLSGGFAIWLTPETMPFVLMAYAVLLIRWWRAPLGAVVAACAAGFFDLLGFGLAVDPPEGGYLAPEIDRLSIVYVVLAFLLLLGSAWLWRLEKRRAAWVRPVGLAVMALAVLAWIALFPRVAMGPYGVLPPGEMKLFFGAIQELQPLRGWQPVIYLLPGVLALGYAVWRAADGRARLVWCYVALCIAVALALGEKFILFVGFSACAAAALLPIALSEASLRFAAWPQRAMAARLGILLAVIGLPWGAAAAGSSPAPAPAGRYPSCALHDIGPLLAPVAGQVVLAEAQDAPELLYRSRIKTVGSLYQHGVPAFLRARAAWRSAPGAVEPEAVAATGASDILFCRSPGGYAPVADAPGETLWGALEAGTPPPWLLPVGSDEAGWRLYRIMSPAGRR